MTTSKIRNTLAACVFAALVAPSAHADDQSKPSSDTKKPDTTKTTTTTTTTTTAGSSDTKPASVEPKIGVAESMKITQTAMMHIAAAEKALDQGNKKAAKAALMKSEKELAKLYNDPALGPLMTELDTAIDSVKGKGSNVNAVDLAPLTASVSTYQEYLDPSVSAGVERARDDVKSGDVSSAQNELRLARNRVAIDTAFIPVEDAYVRVIAAQRALDKGNIKQASRLLDSVPVIVSELEVSQPLLPVRFKLHAAAEAADAGNWDRTETLLSDVDKDLEQLETAATDNDLKSEITSISDEVERLHQDAVAGKNPRPADIRQLAQRVQTVGEDEDQGSKQPQDQMHMRQPDSQPEEKQSPDVPKGS